KGGDVLPLRREQQLRRRFAHLPDASRSRLEFEGKDRLDRIDDDQRGAQARDLFEDALEAGLGKQIERCRLETQALAARLDLMLRFFARAVEDRAGGVREVRRGLKEQRGLADPRLAADQ